MIYHFVCYKIWNKILGSPAFFLAAMLPFLFLSCKKELEQKPVTDNQLLFKASSTDIALNQKQKDKEAINFTWTTGSNQGTNAAITYTLDIDKKGNNFAAPVTIDWGKGVYKQSFTVDQLNEIATRRLGLKPDTAQEIEARVTAKVASAAVAPQVSNIVTIKIKPYTPVSTTLYIIGDAVATGWDANNAPALIADANDPTRFTFTGRLNTGEYKFITTKGQFLPSYNRGADTSHVLLRTADSQPDNKFSITQAGTYTITVDLVDRTITKVRQSAPAYTRLWIVGDATPNGWDINNPNEMKVDPADPFIFTYNEVLKAGEFKIPVATGNWGTDFFMPLTNYPDLSSTGVRLVPGGSPDYKWKIATPGGYKITLNLRDMTISIKPFTPYTALWMVGDATPNGWNINSPNSMVKDAADPNKFTYTGPLNAGEFKIPVATGNWGTDYFMPPVNGQDISGTVAKFVPGGNPDNKWKVATAGNYKVTLDQLRETISIVKQ